MSTLSKQQLIDALTRLGQLAVTVNEHVELLLLGGGLMVLVFDARQSTRDVDVLILAPKDRAKVREIAAVVAGEKGWQADWLNDAAKGFVIGESRGPIVFSAPGITVFRPSIEQLLAMKLCAWRDDVDIADAQRLLHEVAGTYDDLWRRIVPHLQPGRELTAKYAFDDLWEASHGAH